MEDKEESFVCRAFAIRLDTVSTDVLTDSDSSLQKEYSERPNYPTLLQNPFIASGASMPEAMDSFIAQILALPALDAV